MTTESRIVAFYSGAAPDNRGRFLTDIQRWRDSELESVHDFIQWMFPLPEPSPVNPTAPVLDRGTIEAFLRNPELRQQLRASFLRMAAFYGLEWQSGELRRAADFPEQSANWLTPGNHNHLRITRILKCLGLLGLQTEAEAFYRVLAAINRKHPRAITERTFQFWTDAGHFQK